MAIVMKKKIVEPTATVAVAHKDGTVEEESLTPLPTVVVEEQHAVVGVTMGVTRNLGNYESLKITVHLSVPCTNSEESINVAYDTAKQWVDSKVAEINKDIDDQLN